MGKLIYADELEPDTEWSDYYDGFTSYSQSQINEAEEVKAIPVERVKQAREEMDKLASHKVRPISFDQAVAIDMCIKILDKLIEEVEGKSEEEQVQEPILNEAIAEIEAQEKWLAQAGYNAYNVGIAFNAIRLAFDGIYVERS